jgi:hypothetical protein
MPYNAVLSTRIKRLQHHQQRLGPVGIKQVLQLVHALDVLANLGQCLFVRFVLNPYRQDRFAGGGLCCRV